MDKVHFMLALAAPIVPTVGGTVVVVALGLYAAVAIYDFSVAHLSEKQRFSKSEMKK